jgi:hypothetical protein
MELLLGWISVLADVSTPSMCVKATFKTNYGKHMSKFYIRLVVKTEVPEKAIEVFLSLHRGKRSAVLKRLGRTVT